MASDMRIGTLRARGEDAGTAARRLSMERALDTAGLTPTGFPPRAVLVVRRIVSAFPSGGPEASGPWADEVRMRLEALWHHAARPIHGTVDAGAEAVLFADEAELRACLVLDLAAGTAWRRWWWASWLGRLPGSSGVSAAMTAVLAESVADLPAVIAVLLRCDGLRAVSRAIAPEHANGLVRQLAQVFQLPVIADAFGNGGPPRSMAWAPPRAHDETAPSPPGARARTRRSGEHGKRLMAAGLAAEEAERQVDPFLRGLVETLSPSAPRATALLLLLGMMLAREPWRLRSPDVQKALMRRSRLDAFGTTDAWRRAWGGVADEAARFRTDEPRFIRVPLPRTARDGEARHRQIRKSAGPGAYGDPATARPSKAGPVATALPTRCARASSGDGPAERPDAMTEPVTTGLGGVLYLINLMTALDLPECLESQWRLASRVGPWDLLETLARYWSAGFGYEDDELWPLLARLGGRSGGELPGGGHMGTGDYRQPSGWLDQAGRTSTTLEWCSVGGRLRLWSDEDGLIADVARDRRRAADQVREEAIRGGFDAFLPLRHVARRRAPADAKLPFPAHPDYAALLGALLPAVQRRLALALGVKADDRAAVFELLQLRARLHLSSSHLDLVANIDDISLPARRAGLDRDPGWLPNFGRVVLFHFE